MVSYLAQLVIDSDEKDLFVRLTMQALYLCQKAQPGITTTILFLITRLKEPDRDDYKKFA